MKSIVRSGLVLFLSLAMVNASFALPKKTGDDDDIDDLIIERVGGGETAASRRDGLAGADGDSTPTRQSPAEDEVPPRNCGTFWTEWGKSADGLNACPDHCQPTGEALVQPHKPTGSGETLYRARNSCVWKPSIEADMTRKLTQPIPASAELKNCGTAWTDWLEVPEGVNPCPENCGPAGAPLVHVSRYGSDEPLKYSVRYQCYHGIQMAAAPTPTPQISPEARPTRRLGRRNDLDNATVNAVPEEPAPQISASDRPTGGFGNIGGVGAAATDPAPPQPTAPPSGERFMGIMGGEQGDLELAVADAGQPAPSVISVRPTSPTVITVAMEQLANSSFPDHLDDPAWTPVAWEINVMRVGTNVSAAVFRGGFVATHYIGGIWKRAETGATGHLLPALDYDVWATTEYKDGTRKASDVHRVRMPEPVNPSDFAAAAFGPSSARLTWTAIPGASSYFVEGSGRSRVAVTETTLTVANVGPGNHEWRLVAAYGKEGVYNDLDPSITTLTIGGGAGAPAHAQAQTSGRFRVTVNGFRVVRQTLDDPLQLDGKGDEVYIAVKVEVYDRNTKQRTQANIVKSNVFGDTSGFSSGGRTFAGTAGDTGGLRSGDVYPEPNPAVRPGNPGASTLPLAVWEGELVTGGDAVLLGPSIWEWDGDSRPYERNFVDRFSLRGAGTKLGRDDVISALLAPQIGAIRIYKWADVEGNFLGGCTDRLGDRAIGMAYFTLDMGCYYDRIIVLTREVVENELARSSTVGGLAPGTIAIQYRDDPYMDSSLGGDYTLYLQIERL